MGHHGLCLTADCSIRLLDSRPAKGEADDLADLLSQVRLQRVVVALAVLWAALLVERYLV